MCSEIHQYSSFLRRMSSSDKSQNFPVERENPCSSPQTVDEEKGNLDRADDHQKETEEIKKEEEETDKATVSCRESEKQISEDDDGFKTPTSSEHRIPAIMQCPPAPKKPRLPQSKLKRKASPPPGACRSLQLDASTAEVESIFRPIPSDQDDTQDQKIKKARTDDKEPS